MKYDGAMLDFLRKEENAYLTITTKIGSHLSGWLESTSVDECGVGSNILLNDADRISIIAIKDIVSIERDLDIDRQRTHFLNQLNEGCGS